MKTETMKTETIRLSRAILDDVYRGDTLKVKIDKYEYHFLLQRITKLKGKDSIKEKNSILKDLLKHKVLEIKKEDITTLILKDTFTIRVGIELPFPKGRRFLFQ